MSDSTVLRVRTQVQQWLSEAFSVIHAGEPGELDFRLPFDNTFVTVAIADIGDLGVAIVTRAPAIYNVPVTNEFKDWVLDKSGNLTFGGLVYFEDDEGANVIVKEAILGQYVDKEELIAAVGVVLAFAERYGAEIKETFGGIQPLDYTS